MSLQINTVAYLNANPALKEEIEDRVKRAAFSRNEVLLIMFFENTKWPWWKGLEDDDEKGNDNVDLEIPDEEDIDIVKGEVPKVSVPGQGIKMWERSIETNESGRITY